nr:DUF3880 domain-containing protein [uncultured Catonella sp.]
MNKTILLIDSPSFGKFDMIDTMKETGFNVELFYHDNILSYPNNSEFDEAFDYMFVKKEYLFVFSFNYFPSVSNGCKRHNVKYLAFVYDNPLTSLYSYTVINSINYIFIFDKHSYEELTKLGITTVYYLPLCANVKRLDKMTLSADKSKILSSDVSFVGSLYNEKHNFLERMTDLDEYTKGYIDAIIEAQLKIHGYFFIEELLTKDIVEAMKKSLDYTPNKYGTETVEYVYANYFIARKITAIERNHLLAGVSDKFETKLYTHNNTPELPNIKNMGAVDYYDIMPLVFKYSKINLNITLRSIQTGIPLRCFDIWGAGGFLLTNYQADLFDYFTPGEDFDFYDNEESLLTKIDYYLSHDKERCEIARNAHEKVKADHTYEARLRLMIEVAEIG